MVVLARCSGEATQAMDGFTPSSRLSTSPISWACSRPSAVSGVFFLPEKRFCRLASVWPCREKYSVRPEASSRGIRLLRHNDIGGVFRFHADDMIARIDMQVFTG